MNFYIGSGMKNYDLVNYYAKELKEKGWKQTYDWVKNINNDLVLENIIEYAKFEKEAIEEADVVIILLPAGRGTHIELGMALALNKKIFLCAKTPEEFNIENTVAFYELPSIVKLDRSVDENIKEIMNF